MKSHLKRIMRDSLRMYFAPLTGAYKGIRDEYRRLDAQADQQRELEAARQSSRAGQKRKGPGRQP